MRGLTRRQLCAGTALAGASLGLAGCDPGAPRPPQRNLAAFQPLVGSAFTIQDGADPLSLTLTAIRVHQAPIRTPRPRGESFTLLFEADRPNVLGQGSRPASHPELGSFTFFLVPGPVGPSGRPTFAASYTRL